MGRAWRDWRRVSVAVAVALWALLSFAVAAGAFSLVGQCQIEAWPPGSGLCGQLLQGLLAALAGLALAVGAVQILRARPALTTIFLGTLPLLVAHLWFWLVDPNESAFFPLMAAPPPLLTLLVAAVRRRH